MTKTYDVLGAGIAAVDDLLYVADYPVANAKIPVAGIARRGGGPACTAIAAVGALGGRAAYVARLGSNEWSTYIKSALQRRGVDTARVIFDAEAGPYHSVIIVDNFGNRNVFYDPSLYHGVEAEDLPDSVIQSTALFLLDHLTEPGLLKVAERVHGLGVPILGDLEGRSESAMRLAELTDYLVVPEEFAAWAAGTTAPRSACASLAHVRRLATVVTAGAEGCYFSTDIDHAVVHVPAFQVDAQNTNGCGDTFHGAFALAVARNLAVKDAVVFASAAAALKAAAPAQGGQGWDTLPALDSVLSFLRLRLAEPDRSLLLDKLDLLGPVPREVPERRCGSEALLT